MLTSLMVRARRWGRTSSRSLWVWPAIIIVSTAAVGFVTVAEVEAPARPVIALWFLLICPGMAFVRLLRIQDGFAEWTLAIALSLAFDTVVAGTQLYAGVWSPEGGLLALIGLSLGGVGLQILAAESRRVEAIRKNESLRHPYRNPQSAILAFAFTLLFAAVVGFGIVRLRGADPLPVDVAARRLASAAGSELMGRQKRSANPKQRTVESRVNTDRATREASATATPTSVSAQMPSGSRRLATRTPLPSPNPSPTAPRPSPSPEEAIPASGPPSAATVLEQVAEAEAVLQTGQFEATLNYRDGSQSSATVLFDLGGDATVPRLYMTTTYGSPGATSTVERVTIGDYSWQRQPTGRWLPVTEQEGVPGRVQAFLPRATTVSNPELDSGGYALVLRWYDAGRDADVTLNLDPATGVPLVMRQVTRSSGAVLTVTYRGWNTPVEIAQPPGTWYTKGREQGSSRP